VKHNFNAWARRFFACMVCGIFAVSVVWADQISVEQAAEIAARFTNEQPQLSRMHKAPRKASNMRLAHKALQNNSADAAFYVFNQESDKGFVIVSADDRTADEVLCYSEKGSFDAEHINPNFQWWLNRYAEEITVLQTIDDSEFIDEPATRKAKQVTAIPNLLVNKDGTEITWDQLTPYNNLCPTDQRDNTKCYTGCVATAASQIMYKWAWPTKGTGTASYTWKNCMDDNCNNYKEKTLTVNPGNTTYDWDNMIPGYSGKSYTTTQATAVATLMYHAGVATEMSYGGEKNGGSGAWTDQMAYGLKTYFGYKFEKFITMYSKSNYGTAAVSPAEYSVTRDQFINYFNADLEAGRPILMGGEDTGGNGGHEFVCCGRDANNKFYINWGWEGDGNCYVALSSLKPSGSSYNFSNNLDALIGLCPDKKDLPKVTVTWSVDGVETPVEFTQEDALELPTNPANCESGKVFVGWTANSSVDGSKPADLFTSAGSKTVMEDITYYAVFAVAEGEGGGGEPEENKYTFTSKAWADATNSWSSDKDGGQLTSGQGVQVTAGYSGAGATTKSAVENVSKVTVNYCTNATKGAGSIDITVGSTKVSHDVTKDGGTTLRDLDFAFNNVSGKVSIVVNCTTNSIYVNSVTITSGSGSSTTYSDYSLNCGTPCEGTLTSITLNTTNVKKTFTEGDEFTYAGLVVTANYDGCDSKTVTPTSVSTPDMSTAGNKTVTVSYTENEITKQKTYEITVNALPTYAIRFFNNGVQVGETQNVKEGQKATKPATDPTACDGYTFAGWWTAELAKTNTDAKTWITDFTATKDQDYYAAYSHTEEGESGGSETIEDELTRATTGVSGTSYSNWSGKTVTSDAVYAGNSAGGNDAIQLRSSNSNSGIITTTSGGKLKKVVVTWNSSTASGRKIDIYGKNAAYSAATDLYNSSTQGTKLGSIADTQTELTVSGDYTYVGVRSNSGALYLDDITFTWEAGSGPSSTTYYTTATDCTLPTQVTVTFNANGGTGEMSAQVITYNEATALNACTFTREGHSFAGWATSEMGNVVYADKAEVTLTKNTTLFAKWNVNIYTINLATVSHGTISTSPAGNANYGATVTVTATPDDNYTLGSITVVDEDEQAVEMSGNTFTMPASNVTVRATFNEKQQYTIRFFNNGSQIGEDQKIYEGETPEVPSNPEPECKDYSFVGWWTDSLPKDNTEAKTWITDFTVTKDQNYYAIFKKTEESEGGQAASVTFKDADQESNIDASSEAGKIRKDLVEEESGIASYSGSKVYASQYGAKLGSSKASGKLDIELSSSVTTKTITLNAKQYGSDTGSLSVTVNGGTAFGSAQKPSVDGGNLTFTASSEVEISSVTIATSSKRAYVKSVTIGTSSSSTTYYSSYEYCKESDIESVETAQPVAIKALRNGQIVIIRGAEVYSITGARIK